MARKPSSLDQFQAMVNDLASGQSKPVCLFFGEESFFLDRLQQAAIDRIPAEARDFNLDILHGEGLSAEKLLGICRSYPLMAEQRAVVVKDFLKMFESHTAESDADKADVASENRSQGVDDLLAYIRRPNPSTLLVLLSARKPAANTRLGKGLKTSTQALVHTFDPVADYQLQKWIRQWTLATHQIEIDEQAADLLAYYTGNHLQQLTSEIAKLASFVKEKGQITTDVVKQIVGFSREFSLFDFSDALLERRTDRALLVASQMMASSDSPAGEVIKMVGFLYGTFTKMWHIQRLSQKGLSPSSIREQTGIKSTFYYNKLVQSARNFPLSVYPAVLETLLDADMAVKGFSRETPEAVMYMTVKKLTG